MRKRRLTAAEGHHDAAPIEIRGKIDRAFVPVHRVASACSNPVRATACRQAGGNSPFFGAGRPLKRRPRAWSSARAALLPLRSQSVAVQPRLASLVEQRRSPMITAIVRFKLPEGTSLETAKAMFEKSAPNYKSAPGLVRKYYLFGEDRTGGGVYLWESREA